MPLFALNDLKSYLQIPVADTSDDLFLGLLVGSIQAMVENYCHRKFDVTAYVGEQHLTNHKIFTNNYPIISVESIVRYDAEVGGVLPDTSGISGYRTFPGYVDMLDYQYVTMAGKLRYVNQEESYVSIDYHAGYATMPADLVLASLKLASLEYKDSREGRLGVDAEREGQVQYTYSKKESAIPASISEVLDRYKAVRF